MLCCPMSDGLYSLSEVIISLSKKTQPGKTDGGVSITNMLIIETRHLFRRFWSLLAYSGIVKLFSFIDLLGSKSCQGSPEADILSSFGSL